MEKAAREIFEKIAIQNGVDLQSVIRDMERAIDEGLANPESRSMLEAVPHMGDKPTPEEVVLYVASKVTGQENKEKAC